MLMPLRLITMPNSERSERVILPSPAHHAIFADRVKRKRFMPSAPAALCRPFAMLTPPQSARYAMLMPLRLVADDAAMRR